MKLKLYQFKIIVTLVLSVACGMAYCAEPEPVDCTVFENPQTPLEDRICHEDRLRHEPFVLVPYKPNYFVVSWDDSLKDQNATYDNFETKFQLSFKIPLNKYLPDTRWLWYFGYTQISTWQMFSFDESAPFRDTNFEPELMVYQTFNSQVFNTNWYLRLVQYGLINHQSNGKVPPNSRSWNKSYIDLIFENNRNYLSFKVWKRWSEEPKANPTDLIGDDNPDLEDYVGHGQLRYMYVGESSNYAITYRDSSEGGGRGTYQLDWSRPIKGEKGLRLYVQYYSGYGETLIDYNIKRERLGVGLMLTDWL